MTTDAGAIPDLLNWYEGMLLLPEHFQKADRRQETLLPYLTSAASPYAWGISALETRLDNGAFEVTRVEAIMPDGLLVDFRGPGVVDPPLQLKLGEIKTAPALQTIYLVVPRWTDDALGIGGQARYRKSKGAVLTQGDPLYPPVDPQDAEQPWLRPTLDLRSDAQGPLPDKLVRLAVARIRLQEMRYVLERLQPPRFWVARHDPVYDLTRTVADRLREEARKLYERLQTEKLVNGATAPPPKPAPRAPSPAGSPAESPEDRLLQAMRLLDEKAQSLQAKAVQLERQAEPRADLRALARTLPRLEALLATRPHPFHLYLALCDVIGDISVLAGELAIPDAVPAYDHSDLLPAFDNMVTYIWAVLDKLNFKYRKVYFKTPAPGEFTLDLTVDALEVPPSAICQSDGAARVFIIGAVIGEGHDRSAVVKWMDLAIIATRQKLEDQLLSRVTGAYRKRIDEFAPFDLKAPPWTLLYRVEVEEHAIDLAAGPLIVRNDDGPGAPDQIILYLATGPGGAAS
jgi:type VI secretion system protein ImpJ